MSAHKGQWVQVHEIVLQPEGRAAQVPDDTKQVPLEMWVKGYLETDAELGEVCTVKTLTGRLVSGKLTAVEAPYSHSFGDYIEELGTIRNQVRGLLA